MSDRVAGGPMLSRDRRDGRGRWLPLWSLQVIELIVAFAFVDISIHVSNGGLLVGVAVALVVLAVTAQGPLGIFRICPPGLHLILVVVTATVAAVAPVVPALRPDIEGIIVLEFGAVGLIRVATLTETTGPRRVGANRRGSAAAVIDATATVAGPGCATGGPDADPEPSRAASPRATRGQGDGVAAPVTTDAGAAAARWAGRTAATAAVTGRQAVARHRPGAEERVKRTIRNAGRLAGRFTAPSDPDKTDG